MDEYDHLWRWDRPLVDRALWRGLAWGVVGDLLIIAAVGLAIAGVAWALHALTGAAA